MKKIRRFLCLTLALMMCFGTLSAGLRVNAAGSSLSNFAKSKTYASQFTDVKSSAWYYSGVKSAYEYGLMKGSSTSAFGVKGNVTYAEAVAMAVRIYGIYTTGREPSLSTSPWWWGYMEYAYEYDIIDDFDLYALNANKPITRARFAILFANALPASALAAKNNIADGAIPDVIQSDEYGWAVYRLYNAGILVGSDDKGTFYPSSNILRVEVATIVMRMAVSSTRQSLSLEAPKPEPLAIADMEYFTRRNGSKTAAMDGDDGARFTKFDRATDNLGNEHLDPLRIQYSLYKEYWETYLLPDGYTDFSGTIFIDYKSRSSTSYCYMRVYGDGKLLYDSPKITRGVKPVDFSIDITGVEELKIQVNGTWNNAYSWLTVYIGEGYLTAE